MRLCIEHGRKREFENIESLIFNLNSNNSSAYFQPPFRAPSQSDSTAEVTAEHIPSPFLSLSLSLFSVPLSSSLLATIRRSTRTIRMSFKGLR